MGRYDHDGCEECLYLYNDDSEVPCCYCKGTVLRSSEEYNKRKDYWEPDGQDENDAEPISNENSPIDHPAHYTQGNIECIDAMESAFGVEELAAYCKIAAFKYIWRCKLKNGLEDVDKAMWYLKKFKELKEKGNAEK